MIPSIKCKLLTSDTGMKPQTITELLPCLAVSQRFFIFRSSFGFRQTITLPSDPKILNLLSSVNSKCFQKLKSFPTCVSVNSIRHFTYFGDTNVFRLATRPWNVMFSKHSTHSFWLYEILFLRYLLPEILFRFNCEFRCTYLGVSINLAKKLTLNRSIDNFLQRCFGFDFTSMVNFVAIYYTLYGSTPFSNKFGDFQLIFAIFV